MSLISLIIILAAVGLILWLVTTYIPMDATIKKIIYVVAIVCVIIYLLSAFGVIDDIKDIKVPR